MNGFRCAWVVVLLSSTIGTRVVQERSGGKKASVCATRTYPGSNAVHSFLGFLYSTAYLFTPPTPPFLPNCLLAFLPLPAFVLLLLRLLLLRLPRSTTCGTARSWWARCRGPSGSTTAPTVRIAVYYTQVVYIASLYS